MKPCEKALECRAGREFYGPQRRTVWARNRARELEGLLQVRKCSRRSSGRF